MEKKRLFSMAFSLLVLVSSIGAQEVSVETATKVSQNLLLSRNQAIKSSSINVKVTPIMSKTNATLLYIVNAEDGNGWVAVSGTYAADPILAYSTQGTLSVDRLSFPFPLNVLFDGYVSELDELVSTKAEIAPEVKKKWDHILNINSLSVKNTNAIVGPLLTTKWDQTNHYNDKCPAANQGSNAWLYGENVVTGCVPLAMAMIIKYHKYPATDNNGVSYNYTSMPNQLANGAHNDYILLSSVTVAQKDEVAKLIYNCGLAAGTTYSSSNPLDSPTSDGNVPGAFKTRFKYGTSDVSNLLQKSGYTDVNWTNLLQTELNANRPLYYRGGGPGAGHAWVIDGYDSGLGKFHCNWGYGVTHNKADGFKFAPDTWDGYFALTNLSPSSSRNHTASQACITIKSATTSAIAQNDQVEKSVLVYQNSTDQSLVIQSVDSKLADQVLVSIYNIQGALVYSKGFGANALNNEVISTEGLNSGMYFIVVQSGNTVVAKEKFIRK